MNRKLILLSLIVLLAAVGVAQEARSNRYTEPEGGFSYVPPKGWVLRRVAIGKYKFASSQPIDGFAPNINVIDEFAVASLDDYVNSQMQGLPKRYEQLGLKNFKVLRQSKFVTNQKLTGIKTVTQSTGNGKTIRQTFYFFEGKNNKKFVVTCSVPEDAGESFDKIFDDSIKSFRTDANAEMSLPRTG